MSKFYVAACVALAASAVVCAPAGAAVERQKLQSLTAGGQLAAAGEYVAVTQTEGFTDSARLLVGKPGALQDTGAKGVPAWAIPHFGTDEQQIPVLVYPSCTDVAKVSTCGLRVNYYSQASRGDESFPHVAVNRPGTGEIEGVLDRGALVFTRWTDRRQPVATSQGGFTRARTSLHYLAVGKSPVVLTKDGGQQLALDRGRVLQIRGVAATIGECATESRVDLIRVATKMRTVIAKQGCGEDFQTLLSPVFASGRVAFVMRAASGSFLRSVTTTGGDPRFAPVPGGLKAGAIIPTGVASALLVHGNYFGGLDPEDPQAGAPWSLQRVTGLMPRRGRQ